MTAAGPVTGDSIECRTYHAHAAAREGTAHCPHAAFESSQYCTSLKCIVYCQAFEQACGRSASAAASAQVLCADELSLARGPQG